MDWLQIAANIAQVLSVIWALIFGGKLIHDVVKSILNRTRMRVVLTITNILLAAILLVLVSPHATLLSALFRRPISPSPCDVAPIQQTTGIGVTSASDGQCVGITDGSFSFDTARHDGSLKLQAAASFQAHHISDALGKWNDAASADTSDAEPLINVENQRVLGSSLSHVTLVLATFLTGKFTHDGEDTLQGAYVAQKENDDACVKEAHDCLLVRLLIANVGSGSNNESPSIAPVAQQIIEAAKHDPTIIGVIDGLTSQSTFDMNKVLVADSRHRLPMVAAKASSDFLTGLSHFFRVIPKNDVQAQYAAQYASGDILHAHRIAVFYIAGNTYSGNLKDDFIRHFKDSTHHIVATEMYPSEDAATLRRDVSDALEHTPDLIYCACYVEDINVLLPELSKHGSSLQVLGGDALYELGDYSPDVRPELHRLHFTAFSYPDVWSYLGKSEPLPPFFNDYKKIFNPDGAYGEGVYGHTRTDSGVMVSFDATLAMITGSRRALAANTNKGSVTPDALETALTSISGSHAIQGVTGRISFSTDGDPVDKTIVVISVVVDGQNGNIYFHMDSSGGGGTFT